MNAALLETIDAWTAAGKLQEADAGGHWVTLHGHDGIRTAVFIDNGGNISKGPSHLIGHNIAHLPPSPNQSETPAGGMLPKAHTHHAPTRTPDEAAQYQDQQPAQKRPRSQMPLPKETQSAYANAHTEQMEAYKHEVGIRFSTWLDNHMDEAKAEYRKRFGNVMNVDNARELSPEYNASIEARSTLASAVQRGASKLNKAVYADALAAPTPKDKVKRVVFMAGGAGAGKTSATESIPSVKAILDRSKIIYDATMSDPASTGMIDRALQSGHHVTLIYVHRDPVEAFAHGVLPRAERHGRTVPLNVHALGHLGAQATLQHLAQYYKDNPHVTIRVIDNSRGKGMQQEVPLESMKSAKQYTEEGLVKELRGTLEDARYGRNGHAKISQRVYNGIKA